MQTGAGEGKRAWTARKAKVKVPPGQSLKQELLDWMEQEEEDTFIGDQTLRNWVQQDAGSSVATYVRSRRP